VEPRGFEPLASTVQKRYDTLQELSGACKTPAKAQFSSFMPFPRFQALYSGCCTVAAQTLRPTTAQDPARSLLVYPPDGHL
jgi:hypothetical protein